MTIQEFQDTNQPLPDWSIILQALWYDKKGDWNLAHDLIDSQSGENEVWLHAYLHRKEGDQWNANYWYRRAGKSIPNMNLDEEWEYLVNYFLV